MAKLPKLPNRYTINIFSKYYQKLLLSENFKLDSTIEDCLFNLLKNIQVTKEAGIAQNLEKILKDVERIFAKLISELCNLYMTLGSFHDRCKIVKVKPLFKKSSRTDPSNYRPISLLPLLSKVFERFALDQTK